MGTDNTRMQLNMGSIMEIDRAPGKPGRIAEAFDRALRQATQDIIDREGVASARTVTLKVIMTPITDDEHGLLEDIDVQFEIASRIPARSSAVFRMMPTRDGLLYFQPASPKDPRQAGLPFPRPVPPGVDPETGEETEPNQ